MTHVPPVSSLIFVVILAVWAVYLVQHWVRRRDHLATARSVDRFSEAMRVLERRRALPRPDLTEPAPRSYSVSPLRPARPQVVVKRGPAGATAAPAALALDPARPGATAVAPTTAYRRARTASRVRAAALLLSSFTMVVLVALSSTGVLAAWWTYVGIGALAVSVALVRWSVSRSRNGARTAPAPRARTASGASRARPAPRPAARRAPARSRPAPTREEPLTAVATKPAAPAPADVPHHAFARQSVAVTTRTARRSVSAVALYDIDEVEATLRPRGTVDPQIHDTPAPVGEQEVAPAEGVAGTWDPVPVPPPTYTLKARAPRGANGSAQLPADGAVMALDEEFEELPHVDRVG
ncbi:hypothetical protein SAMN05421879_102302 [Ornithinimicrobium cerasi]|uniref:Uncharacterized protein n=1 Tax=Ornithinimicrobium cerasi TaxID=2248773 RepID=A0A285VIT3_9MICO|nr:hypothetical protein SAMN05421879_102302 [Ornithinimicrobium cerasi]